MRCARMEVHTLWKVTMTVCLEGSCKLTVSLSSRLRKTQRESTNGQKQEDQVQSMKGDHEEEEAKATVHIVH